MNAQPIKDDFETNADPLARHFKKGAKPVFAPSKDPHERLAENDLHHRALKAQRKARVAVTYVTTTRAERYAEHKSRMNDRKVKNGEMPVGFHPVANARVTTFYQTQYALQIAAGLSHVDAHNRAWNMTIRGLPAPRMVKGPPRPSKSDDPAYRRGRGLFPDVGKLV